MGVCQLKKLLFLLLLFLNFSQAWATNYCSDASAKGCWTFENGSGTTVTDQTSNHHDGTFNSSGHPAWTSASTSGSWSSWATSFNGVDTQDGIVTPIVSTVSQDFTVLAFVKWAGTTGADQQIVFNGDTGTSGWGLFWWTSNSYVNLLYAGVVVYSFGESLSGNWQLITATSATTDYPHDVSLRIDGVETYATKSLAPTPIGSYTYIGRQQGNNENFNGLIDDSAIFERPLTQTEISDIYDHGLSPSGGTPARHNLIIISE
jgi:hypothetical protein